MLHAQSTLSLLQRQDSRPSVELNGLPWGIVRGSKEEEAAFIEVLRCKFKAWGLLA